MNQTFPNMNSILLWAKTDNYKMLDENLWYVKSSKDSNFYYFKFQPKIYGKAYQLLMISSRDLGEEPKQ